MHTTPILIKTRNQTRAQQLAAGFAQRIRDRLWAAGTRLPSVRQCAAQHGVSPSTVVAAYDLLLAQGLLEARKNRGFYVRDTSLRLSGAQGSAQGPWPADSAAGAAHGGLPPAGAEGWRGRAPVNATALVRGMFFGIGDKPQPGLGVLPPDWLANTFLSSALRRHCSTQALNALSLQYGEPQGDTGLRQALALKLSEMAVQAQSGQIITTVGATHALDIVSRTLLRAGDCVMVEEPGWAVEFARLEALGMRILPVPRHAAGPDLEVMAQYCQMHQPKLFVSVSVLHNPTGYCLSPASAHRILQLANQYQFHILEDDTYGHFAPDYATRLCALDGLQRSIYVSGFSKILAPNWRVGFLAAPPDLVERLLDTKLLSTLTTPALLEKAVAWCLQQGLIRRHTQNVLQRLDGARQRSVQLAQAHGFGFAAPPAGLFGWLETGVDSEALSQRMLDAGYLLAPGALFHANLAASSLMRINFSTTQDPEFWRILRSFCA
jgi:DNA-binding transcriptional MocR family regulator